MQTIKIIVADDHPLFRSGVMDVVAKIEGVVVAGEAENGMKAYQSIL